MDGLRRMRELAGLTQEELANRLGYTWQSVANAEGPMGFPSRITYLLELTKATGVEVLVRQGEMYPRLPLRPQGGLTKAVLEAERDNTDEVTWRSGIEQACHLGALDALAGHLLKHYRVPDHLVEYLEAPSEVLKRLFPPPDPASDGGHVTFGFEASFNPDNAASVVACHHPGLGWFVVDTVLDFVRTPDRLEWSELEIDLCIAAACNLHLDTLRVQG